ncbi:MAG: hypothetical protein NUW01_18970 [Gemmatimonadaceae bacterium]|nr:hypothetical protein [Gemmatimonadaceae bacterium]
MNDPLSSGSTTATATSFGDPLARPMPQATSLVAASGTTTIDTGGIILNAEQGNRAVQALKGLDFMVMPSAQIAILGRDAEQGLHQTLDGFLARLDSKTAAALFKLFDRLQQGVQDADLQTVLKDVQQVDKLGFFEKLFGKLRGKGVDDLIREAYDKLRGVMVGKTNTLKDEMNKLEKELGIECNRLLQELQVLEKLKQSYSGHRENFAVAAAVAHAFLEQSKLQVAAFEAEVAATPDALKRARLQELQAKLQMLESRALALEGTYTRLPADQLVIQQIEQAGVSTLQETVTTASARFASIKMTLLALHGALTVKSLQNMAQQNAKLDAQLNAVRGALVKDIAATAANAPGDNRLAQAAQIEQIIKDAKEVDEIVTKARADNAAKFTTARAIFQKAREDLAKV